MKSESQSVAPANQAQKKVLKVKKDRYVYGTMTRVAGPKGSQQAARTGNVRKNQEEKIHNEWWVR